MMRLASIAIFLAVFSVSNEAMSAEVFPDTSAGRLVAKAEPLIIGHRGNSKFAPENTLPSFEQAVKLKADLVELDYYVCGDGRHVVFHDKDLDRCTNAPQILGQKKLLIHEAKFDDLRRLDAGMWFKPEFAGTKVPSLEEALDVIQAGSTTLIEHKGGSAEACLKLLEEKKLLDQVVVQSFDWKYLAELHRQNPHVVIAALGGKDLTAEKIAQAKETGAKIIGWDQRFIAKRDIDLAHREGLKIWVYTANEPARMRQLLEDGIDGIITDDPATGREIRATFLAE